MTGLTITLYGLSFHLSEKARMPPFDNSIYFPCEARRGSSRLYFSPEKATLRMASIIFSSPADKDCTLCSLFFLRDHGEMWFGVSFWPGKTALREEHLPQESFRQELLTTHLLKTK